MSSTNENEVILVVAFDGIEEVTANEAGLFGASIMESPMLKVSSSSVAQIIKAMMESPVVRSKWLVYATGPIEGAESESILEYLDARMRKPVFKSEDGSKVLLGSRNLVATRGSIEEVFGAKFLDFHAAKQADLVKGNEKVQTVAPAVQGKAGGVVEKQASVSHLDDDMPPITVDDGESNVVISDLVTSSEQESVRVGVAQDQVGKVSEPNVSSGGSAPRSTPPVYKASSFQSGAGKQMRPPERVSSPVVDQGSLPAESKQPPAPSASGAKMAPPPAFKAPSISRTLPSTPVKTDSGSQKVENKSVTSATSGSVPPARSQMQPNAPAPSARAAAPTVRMAPPPVRSSGL